MKYLKNIDLPSVAFVAVIIKVLGFTQSGLQIVDSVMLCAVSAVLAYNLHLKSKKKTDIEKKLEVEMQKLRDDLAKDLQAITSEVGKMKMGATQKKPFKF